MLATNVISETIKTAPNKKVIDELSTIGSQKLIFSIHFR